MPKELPLCAQCAGSCSSPYASCGNSAANSAASITVRSGRSHGRVRFGPPSGFISRVMRTSKGMPMRSPLRLRTAISTLSTVLRSTASPSPMCRSMLRWPTLNCVRPSCVSPFMSVTCASTVYTKVGSAARAIDRSAAARNSTVKAPAASVRPAPLAISVGRPHGMMLRQYQPHHHGMRASRITFQRTSAPSRGTPAWLFAVPLTVACSPSFGAVATGSNTTSKVGRLYSSTRMCRLPCGSLMAMAPVSTPCGAVKVPWKAPWSSVTASCRAISSPLASVNRTVVRCPAFTTVVPPRFTETMPL